MSEYSQLVYEFFTRYEKPELEQLTIGFSGIDPPLKVNPSKIDHEKLNHLLGGSEEEGHYHLTKSEWEAVLKLLGELPQDDDDKETYDGGGSDTGDDEFTEFYDGGFSSTTDEEYNANQSKWLDGGFSPND